MSYITNEEDERLLSSSDFQEKMAKTLSASIKKFFRP